MKKSTLIIISMLTVTAGQSQRVDRNLLLSPLVGSKEDTNKVNTLIQLGDTINEDAQLMYATLAFSLAKKINFKKGMIRSSDLLASYYDNHGQFINAREY